ncbi:MAG: polysaccharide biosynthesis C-terminal domain-containing protein [Cytophagales bacterium]|nr:polysaccharide biosynthesis C-terminal domain-containing protein [Cytophagales bacterium]
MMSKQKIIQALSGNVIEVALGFITIMFITRNYTQEQAGIYFLIMAIVAVLNNLKEGFLQNGFVKYYVESQGDRTILQSGLLITWAWDVLNVVVFGCITFFNESLAPFLPFYLIQVVGYSHYRWTLFIHKSDLNLATIFRVNILVLVGVCSGLLMVYLWQLPIHYCLMAAGIAYGLGTFSFPENRNLLFKALWGRPSKQRLYQLCNFGKYGFLKELSGSISHQSGVFLAAYFLTMGDTALLGLANRYAVLIAIPGSSLSGLIYPILLKVGIDSGKLRAAASEGIGKMYALLIPLALMICLASPLLIIGLHGSTYAFAAIILIIRVLLTTFLLPLGTGFSSIMNVMNHPERITKLVLITSLVNLTAMIISMPYLGIWGAMLCPVLTEIVGFVIMKKGLRVIQLHMSDIAIQVMQFWRYWFRAWVPGLWMKRRIGAQASQSEAF